MLVQLDRREHRPFTATATDLPLGPATVTAPPVVAVLGSRSRVGGLSAHLPAGWTVRMARDLDDVRPDEVVLRAQSSFGQPQLQDRGRLSSDGE
jgi:hypothetical protein